MNRILNQSVRQPLRLGLLCLLGLSCGISAARAGLQMDMHLYGSYFCFPWLSTNSTPPSPANTAYFVWSPTSTINSGIHFQLNPDNTIAGSGSSWFSDYQAFIHEITNGNWTLLVTNNVSTNQYTFQVTVPPTITSSLFAPVSITSPTDGQINVDNTPTFTWTGPVGWAGSLEVWDNSVDNNGNQTTVTSESLAPDQTSWPSPVTLPDGTNSFTARYTSNATAVVTVSTPVDSLSQPFPGFSFISTLETYSDRTFSVGTPVSPPTFGHTNVAHYTFDDSGNLHLDSSGNGNDMSGATWWGPTHEFDTDAKAGGGAIEFFGTSCMPATSQTLINLNAVLAGSFTFSAWVKTTVTNGLDYNMAFYGAAIFWAYNDQGGTNDTIPLSITGSKAAFSTRGENPGAFDNLHSTTSVNDGSYHLITVTRNQVTGEKKIYVDGNFEASETGTTNPLNGNNYRLTLGGWAYLLESNSTVTNYSSYKGLLDDVQVYSGILSDAEVASLYGNPGTTIPDIGNSANGAVVHYDFDGGTELAADVSGNGNNVVYAGNFGGSGPAISLDTIAGEGSVSFDGGSYLTASPNLLSTLAGEFSVSLWLKTSQGLGSEWDHAWGGAGVIAADSPNSGARDLIPVALTGGMVAFGIGDGSSDNTLHSSFAVNDDVWHHVVVTRNLTTGERQIFIDGTLDSSDTAATVLLDSPVLLTIGAKSDASDSDPASPDWNGSNGYEGLVDDIQMYNWVLSASEVAELFADPGTTVTHDLSAHLVGRYDFEDTGSSGLDSSGNGNHANCGTGNGGTNYNTSSMDAAVGSYSRQFLGDDGICFSPNGADCFLNLSNALHGSFSWTAWVKTTNSVNSDWANAYFGSPILFEYSDGANQAILSITGSKAAFTVGNPNGGSDTILHSTTTVNDGNYHFIAATRNQTTGLVKLYVDGSLEATDVSTNHHIIAAATFYLAGGYSGFFKGELDDVRIYRGELSASEVSNLSGHPLDDFNTALGSGTLTWSTSGDSSWFVETTNTYNGSPSAAQSGSVINDQSSTLSTTVTGPGTLTFYWASQDDCGSFDYEFDIDGSYQADIYCGTPWTQAGPFTIGSGVHTLSWTVYSNWDTDPSQAGFLDEVTFIPDLTPIITLNPFNQTNYPGYNVALLAAATNSSSITWQWFKVGNASPIPNATNALFIPTDSGTAGVAGSYYAVASSPGGSTPTTAAVVSFASAPMPPDWARALKSPFGPVDASVFNKDYYLGCAVNSAGDIYVAAQYFGNMNVHTNGNIENTLTAPGSSGAALVKHSSNGNALWAVGLTNNQTGNSYGLTVAVAPGNGAYLASQINGTNWLGTNKFVETAGGSLLLSRFDSSGSNVWSKLIGGTNSVRTSYNLLVSDDSGNVTLAGSMSGTVSFGGTNLSAPAGGGFIVQYDATGAIRWAQTVPVYTSGLAYGSGLLYVSLQSTVSDGVTNVSIGSLSNVTDRAWAVACLNATNGQPLWLRGVGHQYGANSAGLTIDGPLISVSGSNVFLTANTFGSSVMFGGLSVPLPGGRGQYFARYDTNGTPWAATVFGSPTTMLWASAASASGVYVTGDFNSYSQFGNLLIAAPVFTTNDLDFSYNGFDYIYFTQPLIAKFDCDGNPLWARNGVSSALANFRGIATTSDGVWVSGFLKTRDISSPAQFGTNAVLSDLYVPGGGGPSPIIFTQAGMIAKITESAGAPSSFVLLNPQTVGSNFQFQFLSQAGFTHSILYRTNLAAGNWQTNSTITGDGTLKTVTIPLSVFNPSAQGFLRVSTE